MPLTSESAMGGVEARGRTPEPAHLRQRRHARCEDVKSQGCEDSKKEMRNRL